MAELAPIRTLPYLIYAVVFITTLGDRVYAHTDSAILSPEHRQKLLDSAQQKFDSMNNAITTQFANGNKVFWQIGNSLDSMVNYCAVAKVDCSAVGASAIAIYEQKVLVKKWWHDDQGWWGELFVRLFDLTSDKKYLEQANKCYDDMVASQYAWDNAPLPLKLQQPPRFPNGRFNTDLKDKNNNDGFTGIQNTVTNALFLKLSLRLFDIHYKAYLATKDQAEAEAAEDYWFDAMEEYQWFKDWFANGLLNYDMAGDHQCLVEERVSSYTDGQCALYYQKNRSWVADNGLMIAALMMLRQKHQQLSQDNPLKLDLQGLDDGALDNIGLSIAEAVNWDFVDTDSGLMKDYEEDDSDKFPGGDWDDYLTGHGVFLRNIEFCALRDNIYQNAFTAPEYKDTISANADKALSTGSSITDIAGLNSVTDDLDAVTTAIALGVPTDLHVPAKFRHRH